jgi:CheY-like chemotaxis protein
MTGSITVFLAEDSRSDVLLIRQALEEQQLDFSLVVARDGSEAASVLNRIGQDLPVPDILLLDLNLPKVEGPELFHLVRNHPHCSTLPLVVITSSDSPKDRAWTATFNVTHYFRKPSELDEFMKLGVLVKEVVASRRMESQGT